MRVEHSLGSVNVRTQVGNQVAVQGTIRCSADNMDSARRLCDQIQIRVEEGASGVTIRTEYPRNGNWPRNMSYSANLEIQMPETAPLDVAKASYFKLDQAAPVAKIDDLKALASLFADLV